MHQALYEPVYLYKASFPGLWPGRLCYITRGTRDVMPSNIKTSRRKLIRGGKAWGRKIGTPTYNSGKECPYAHALLGCPFAYFSGGSKVTLHMHERREGFGISPWNRYILYTCIYMCMCLYRHVYYTSTCRLEWRVDTNRYR